MKRIRAFALRHFETTLIVLIFLGIAATAFLVHLKFSFLNFFFLPVILAGYYLGKRQAVLTASLCVLLVALYLIFVFMIFKKTPGLTMDEILNVVIWAGFLILTAAIIGGIAEQREERLKSLQKAYIGVLEIMLRYLEAADETRPRSLRLSLLAGKIAAAAGLSNVQVENIKSAALLVEAGDLRSNISLYDKVASFISSEAEPAGKLDDRGRVLLKTTALLLKEVEPIMANYFYHYVEEANILDKDLSTIPLGSSIIALADLYDRVSTGISPPAQWKDLVMSAADIRKLSGRAFPDLVVQALFQVVPPIP